MKSKTRKLVFIFVVLFSLQGFSQTTEKSAHPLLDKYYPRPQAAEPPKVVATDLKPAPEIKIPEKVVPEKSTIMPSGKPVAPIAETKVVPETKPLAAIADSSGINKPVQVVNVAPVEPVISPSTQPVVSVAPPKPVVQKAAPTPYNRPRLGSSSPLYDTWEKNNNGAGSVTTGSK